MSRSILLAMATLIAFSAFGVPVEANESDRKARRGAIVAGAIREDVANEVATQRFKECLRDTGYDSACERKLYEDQRRAHRTGRRAAIIVGSEGK